jgi:hypothetical protein
MAPGRVKIGTGSKETLCLIVALLLDFIPTINHAPH